MGEKRVAGGVDRERSLLALEKLEHGRAKQRADRGFVGPTQVYFLLNCGASGKLMSVPPKSLPILEKNDSGNKTNEGKFSTGDCIRVTVWLYCWLDLP